MWNFAYNIFTPILYDGATAFTPSRQILATPMGIAATCAHKSTQAAAHNLLSPART